MRIMLFNHPKAEAARAETVLKEYGHTISKDPEIIITIGGDGTFLLAERKWPGIPKVLIRSKNKLCLKCSNYTIEEVAHALRSGKFSIEEFSKVEAKFKGKKLVGLNEISLRNKDPRTALRFSVKMGEHRGDYIGDGVVVATPFGSSAYFYSITGKTFPQGLGVALNNTSKHEGPFITSEEIMIKILRESATLACDNGELLLAKVGDAITIKQSKEKARVVSLNQT